MNTVNVVASLLVLPALLNLSLCDDLKLLLLHTNDMHSHFVPITASVGICDNETSTSCYGGFARLKTVTDNMTQRAVDQGRQVIYLNAGDSFQGTSYFTFFKWEIVAKFVDMLGLQVMSLGNHEFDNGVAGLTPYISNVSVPIVCANLDISEEPSMNLTNLTPSYVLDINGTKIGVIGYLTPETMTISSTGNVKILDEITYIRKEAQNLLSQGVNILIALGHSGYDKDQEIAMEVEEIDLVVGGHSHTFLYSGTQPDEDVPQGPYPTVVEQASGKKVPVVQAFYATKYLGYLEVDFDSDGNLTSWAGQPLLLSGNWSQNSTIMEALKPYELNISETVDSIVGESDVLMDNTNMKCKLGECNMGNLIADAFVDYVVRNYNTTGGWTMAAIGLIQAGCVRASIDPTSSTYSNGSVSLNDVITVLPWGENVAIINITGSVLLQALEWSVSSYEDTFTGHVSGFLQVSGLHVVYEVNKTVGSRVSSVEVLCADCSVPLYEPLQLNRTYAVVLPQYTSNGGDNFTMFENSEIALLEDVDYMVVAKYIEEHSPVYPAIENRTTLILSSSAITFKTSWTMFFVSALLCIKTSLT